MSAPLWMCLDVNPEPWAVGPIQPVRRGGKIAAFMGKNQQLATFQEAVKEAVREQWGDLPTLEGHMELAVYLWRRRDEYRTEKDRMHRKHDADATNMLKGLEDALQGVLFGNDRDNISVHSHIMQQGADVTGKIIICLQSVDPVEHRRELVENFPSEMKTAIIRSEIHNSGDVENRLAWRGPGG